MASRLILHVGLQKSGTTYLQDVLARSAAELGVAYPPCPPRKNHEWATYGLLGTEYPWVSRQRAAGQSAEWERLEQQVAREPGTVLLSAEALSAIRAPAIRLLLDRLGVADVEVIVTARGLSRVLPSLWQQHVRNGRRLGFERYLRMLEEQRRLGPERIEEDRDLHLWRAFALGGLVRRWAAEVGTARVRVVTSPGSPPEVLWSRFARAAGLPSFDGHGVVGRRVHTGLTAPEVMVLASVNAALAEAGWEAVPARRLREAICVKGFASRPDRGPRIAVPPEWSGRVGKWSVEDITDLRDSGVRIVGDAADLDPDLDGEDHQEPTIEQITAAGAAALLAVAPHGHAHPRTEC
jgi:hypothetical protein